MWDLDTLKAINNTPPSKLSNLCRIELGKIPEEARAENMDVVQLSSPGGKAELRQLLKNIRKQGGTL